MDALQQQLDDCHALMRRHVRVMREAADWCESVARDPAQSYARRWCERGKASAYRFEAELLEQEMKQRGIPC